MKTIALNARQLVALCAFVCLSFTAAKAEPMTEPAPKAWLDGNEPGWRALVETDFVAVNCKPETFTWTNGMIHCTGEPMGVVRSQNSYTNFELVAQWRHLTKGGNSGLYVWASSDSIKSLESGASGPFPAGIEIQVLDHGYTERYEKQTGKKAAWFTTDGDVFPTGSAKMNPFSPAAPGGGRSFPRKKLSKGAGEWNHYYVRCINGEVRLWVNGEEVSGGNNCQPATGYFCIESEGAPVDFRGIKIRELP